MVGSIVQSPFTFFPISNFSSSPTSACRQASSSSTYDGNPRLRGTTDMPRAGPRAGQARQRSQGLSLVAIASNAKVQFVEGTTPRHGGGKRCKIRCRENAYGVIEINSDQWRITCKYMLKYYISSSRLHDDHNMIRTIMMLDFIGLQNLASFPTPRDSHRRFSQTPCLFILQCLVSGSQQGVSNKVPTLQNDLCLSILSSFPGVRLISGYDYGVQTSSCLDIFRYFMIYLGKL